MSYDDKYKIDELYWGEKPTRTCQILLDKLGLKGRSKLSLLDLGTGEGRDALCLAKLGFDVTAFDLSPNGIDKLRKQANENNLKINSFVADIKTFTTEDKVDVCLSSGTLHYLPPEIRFERMEYFKSLTKENGYNVFSVFVEKPFVPIAPDAEDTAYLFKSGELMSYYHDWEIIYCCEEIFDCNSGGTKHQHATNRIIAKKRA